jgi:hypothetical protein
MTLVEVARPPDQIRRMAGEMDHVLAGSTADLDHVARSPGEMPFEYSPERLVIAVEGRRIETAIGLDPPAVPAKFNDIFSQFTSPENEKADQNASKGQAPPKQGRTKPA